MQLQIITPEKIVLDEDVDALLVPTEKGQIEILPHHITFLTKIIPGEMTAKIKNKKDQHLAITGGFLEVKDNIISVLADYAVRSEEIEISKVIEAQKRAEHIIKNKEEQISQRDLAIAEADLRKSILELKVANRRKSQTNNPQS
jgi:F-type H+-transporting ATPase subunit epsilon